MNQDKASFEAANLLSENGMIKDDDFDFIYQLLGQLYCIGYDTGRLEHLAKRPVMQMDLTGRKIQVFDSITIAHRKLNINRRAISATANGKHKTCGGFKWKYID